MSRSKLHQAHPAKRWLREIVVHPCPGRRSRAVLKAGAMILPCAIGRSGTSRAKREGDGATPVGTFRLLQVFYRADRKTRPVTGLTVRAIRQHDGWCDDAASPSYNRLIKLPSRWRHEEMWRSDDLYDLVIDIGWNRGPIRKGAGSAIFLHIAEHNFAPTAGCVAVPSRLAARLLARIGPQTRLRVVG